MTAALVPGVLAFACAFLSDYIGALRCRRGGGALFCLSALLLVLSTLLLVLRRGAGALLGTAAVFRWISLAASVFCLALLMAALGPSLRRGGSGALPPRGEKRPLVDTGLYALCRHPGVLFLGGFFLFLRAALGGAELTAAFLLYTGLDVLYVLWQDRTVFPATISGYDAYRVRVPFLIPDRNSLHACMSDLRRNR